MLLDTCALVWLAKGSKELSAPARQAIEDAPAVYVSAISAFEIAYKYAQGGIDLPCDPARWFQEVLEKHDITEIPLTSEIAIAATKLPRIHKDPCDRFIIATAQLQRLPVVTRDARFQEYSVGILGDSVRE